MQQLRAQYPIPLIVLSLVAMGFLVIFLLFGGTGKTAVSGRSTSDLSSAKYVNTALIEFANYLSRAGNLETPTPSDCSLHTPDPSAPSWVFLEVECKHVGSDFIYSYDASLYENGNVIAFQESRIPLK